MKKTLLLMAVAAHFGSGHANSQYEMGRQSKIRLNIGLKVPPVVVKLPRIEFPQLTIGAKLMRKPNAKPLTIQLPPLPQVSFGDSGGDGTGNGDYGGGAGNGDYGHGPANGDYGHGAGNGDYGDGGQAYYGYQDDAHPDVYGGDQYSAGSQEYEKKTAIGGRESAAAKPSDSSGGAPMHHHYDPNSGAPLFMPPPPMGPPYGPPSGMAHPMPVAAPQQPHQYQPRQHAFASAPRHPIDTHSAATEHYLPPPPSSLGAHRGSIPMPPYIPPMATRVQQLPLYAAGAPVPSHSSAYAPHQHQHPSHSSHHHHHHHQHQHRQHHHRQASASEYNHSMVAPPPPPPPTTKIAARSPMLPYMPPPHLAHQPNPYAAEAAKAMPRYRYDDGDVAYHH